jgi:hypothetical protein
MEGIVLKATWHWGSDSNVINDPLGEPGRTPLYVDHLFLWSLVDGEHIFVPSGLTASKFYLRVDLEILKDWQWNWHCTVNSGMS